MNAAAAPQFEVAWEPRSAPQRAFVTCPVFEAMFGGARGGGKTDAVLGEFAIHAAEYGPGAIGLMVRRERTQLIEAIERSRVIYAPLGAKFNEQAKQWRFPNGARLRFAYLEHDADADAYQGHSYSRVYVEEIGTFPRPEPIMKLMATLRSGAGVPVAFRATANPGGPGHTWVKQRYIDMAPLGLEVHSFPYVNPFTGKVTFRERVFIPSKLSDNPFLGDDYVANLQMSGSEALVRAWLEGDWNVVEGAFFEEFSTRKHVVDPHPLPATWTRFRSIDWGSAKPFCVLWFAISDGTDERYPRGALIVYREYYGAKAANVGLKMTASEVARGIKRLEPLDRITYAVADPSMKIADGGPSHLETMLREGVRFALADNKRLAGWDQVRARLRGTGSDDGRPMLYLFSSCANLIRTLPAMQHDAKKPEDLDSDGEDHAVDALRYGCMSRPIVPVRREARKARIINLNTSTIGELIDFAERQAASRGGKI